MFVVVVYVDYPLGNAHGVFLVVRSFQLIYLGVVNSRKKSRRIDKTKTSQGTLVQVYRDKYSLRKHSTRVIPGFIIPHSKSHSFFFQRCALFSKSPFPTPVRSHGISHNALRSPHLSFSFHKHCFRFLLGCTIAPREIENCLCKVLAGKGVVKCSMGNVQVLVTN